MTSGLTHATDTVERAAATPDQPQPFRELGLKDDEYQRIREILGRRPTDAELAMYSVMWSEHCSYKSSKVHLRYFGETTTDEMRAGMLAGIGENAGVVDIGDGWAVTFKVETHNHPSYVEPYQGAATGVGGIVRDIMAMGARPVAVMDQLRFGAADAPDTRRVLDGVVRGVGGYGNSLGLPNIGGEIVFDACLRGQPAGQRAVRRRAAQGGPAPGVRLGRRQQDHPVRRADRARRHRRRVGAGLGDLRRRRAGSGRKKLPCGAGGRPVHREGAHRVLPRAVRRRAGGRHPGPRRRRIVLRHIRAGSAGDGGMAIELDAVPLRAAGMTPAEVLSSESQERMCAVVTPENVDAFMAVCRKWDVLATVIGEVTDGDRLVITWHGETVVDVPPRTVAHEGPVYQRPVARPDIQDALVADTSARPARPVTGDELRATLLALLGSPNLCSRAWVTEQYDRYVRGNTVLAEPADSGVIRIDERNRPRHRGVHRLHPAATRAGSLRRRPARAGRGVPQRRRHRRHPGRGDQLPELRLTGGPRRDVAVLAGGARPGRWLCGTGHSGHRRQRQLLQPDRDARRSCPRRWSVCSGVIDDVTRRIPTGFGTEPGETLILLGDTRDEFDGSIWAQVTADHLGGRPPRVDLARERLLAEVLSRRRATGWCPRRTTCPRAGWPRPWWKSALAGETGCRIVLPEGADPFVTLFSESAGRVLVAVPRTEESRFTAMCEARGLPAGPYRRGRPRFGRGGGAGPVHGAAGRVAQHI